MNDWLEMVRQTMRTPGADPKTGVKNFGIVSEGRVYRGGAPTMEQVSKLCAAYFVNTLLDLRKESTLRQADLPKGCPTILRHAAFDDHGAPDHELVVQCVELIADEKNQPVFVFCEGGRHRTSIVIAAYRIWKEGWTRSEAKGEAYHHAFYRYRHVPYETYLLSL